MVAPQRRSVYPTVNLMNNYFNQCFTYGNMRKALNLCCRNVRWKDSIVGYELHAPQNTHKLIQQIYSGEYKISPYQHFTIYEPKKRDIVATRIADRQVQMAMCIGGLYDDITEHFIYDNVACQKSKGTDFTISRIKAHMQKYFRKHGNEGWVLKCDIHHFFPSTRHDVAKRAVEKRVGDKRICKMVCDVIDSFGGDVGIGLGSQISQLVELALLDDLDHFIKEKLRIKHYVRYMDDFILIHEDKEYLKLCFEKIKEELTKIGLELNDKTTIYPLRQGVKFMQWRFLLTKTGGVIVKMSNKKLGKERRRLRKLIRKEMNGEIPGGTSENSFVSWTANAERGNEHYRIQRMEQFYKREREKYHEKQRTDLETGTRPESTEMAEREEQGQHRLCCDDDRCRTSGG